MGNKWAFISDDEDTYNLPFDTGSRSFLCAQVENSEDVHTLLQESFHCTAWAAASPNQENKPHSMLCNFPWERVATLIAEAWKIYNMAQSISKCSAGSAKWTDLQRQFWELGSRMLSEDCLGLLAQKKKKLGVKFHPDKMVDVLENYALNAKQKELLQNLFAESIEKTFLSATEFYRPPEQEYLQAPQNPQATLLFRHGQPVIRVSCQPVQSDLDPEGDETTVTMTVPGCEEYESEDVKFEEIKEYGAEVVLQCDWKTRKRNIGEDIVEVRVRTTRDEEHSENHTLLATLQLNGLPMVADLEQAVLQWWKQFKSAKDEDIIVTVKHPKADQWRCSLLVGAPECLEVSLQSQKVVAFGVELYQPWLFVPAVACDAEYFTFTLRRYSPRAESENIELQWIPREADVDTNINLHLASYLETGGDTSGDEWPPSLKPDAEDEASDDDSEWRTRPSTSRYEGHEESTFHPCNAAKGKQDFTFRPWPAKKKRHSGLGFLPGVCFACGRTQNQHTAQRFCRLSPRGFAALKRSMEEYFTAKHQQRRAAQRSWLGAEMRKSGARWRNRKCGRQRWSQSEKPEKKMTENTRQWHNRHEAGDARQERESHCKTKRKQACSTQYWNKSASMYQEEGERNCWEECAYMQQGHNDGKEQHHEERGCHRSERQKREYKTDSQSHWRQEHGEWQKEVGLQSEYEWMAWRKEKEWSEWGKKRKTEQHAQESGRAKRAR